MCAGMLNFGRTGAMQPGGIVILPDKWMDAANIMDDLGAVFFLAVGCRRPVDVDINLMIPCLQYIVTGHASPRFDAVALLVKPSYKDQIVWQPEVSMTTWSCWVAIGKNQVVVGIYIPPRSSATEQEREKFLREFFEKEWDPQKVILARSAKKLHGPPARMTGCGDFNMSPSFQRFADRLLAERNLRWATPSDVPTHVDGGVHDRVWEEAFSGTCGANVHDGDFCHSVGCRSPICGNIEAATGTGDLDHYPCTYEVQGLDLEEQLPVFIGSFVRTAERWGESSSRLAAGALNLAENDIREARRAPLLWCSVRREQHQNVISAVSVMWKMLMVLTAWTSSLIAVRPATQRLRVPRPLREAFSSLREACKKRIGADEASDISRIRVAQLRYKDVAKQCKVEERQKRNSQYMDAVGSDDPPSADRLIASLLAGPSEGLPTYMVNEDGECLDSDEMVLEGAVQYILQRETPPLLAQTRNGDSLKRLPLPPYVRKRSAKCMRN